METAEKVVADMAMLMEGKDLGTLKLVRDMVTEGT